jgi:hypothetical protein
MNRRKQQQHEQWTAAQVARMLANPYYTGIRINPLYAETKITPAERVSWIGNAEKKIRESGPESFLRWLLKSLKNETAQSWCLSGIHVHESFTRDRDAWVSEDQFIRVGITAIREIGATKYLTYLLDNLEASVRSVCMEES